MEDLILVLQHITKEDRYLSRRNTGNEGYNSEFTTDQNKRFIPFIIFFWSRRTLKLRGPSADAAPEPWVIWNQWY